MLNRQNLILVLLAILLGFLLVDNLWLIYFSAVVLFCLFFLKRNYKEKESSFLIKLFLIALFLRLLVVLFIQPYLILYGNKVDIFGDGLPLNANAYIISETLNRDLTTPGSQTALNKQLFELLPLTRVYTEDYVWALPRWVGTLPHPDAYQVSGYAYLLATLFYFFGFKPALGMVFNCLLGSLMPLFVYAITKKISDNNRIPVTAAVLTAFFPSLFLWSIVNEKEITIIFLNLLIVLFWVKIAKEHKWFLLPVIIVLTWIQRYFRSYYLMPLLCYSSVIIFVLISIWVLRKKIVLPFVILLLVFSIAFTSLYPPAKIAVKVHAGLIDGFKRNIFQVLEKGSSYKILPEFYYQRSNIESLQEVDFKNLFVSYCIGIIHFFLEPLPNRIDNFQKLISYPQNILIYLLLIFFIPGIIKALRANISLFIILFLNLFIFASIIAISEGNIGGLLRHRDIITPIFIIFSSLGIVSLLGGEQKLL